MNTRVPPSLLAYPSLIIFDTQADAEGARLPASVEAVEIDQVRYARAGSEPSHEVKFQDALGQWWEIDPNFDANFSPRFFTSRAAAVAATVHSMINTISVMSDLAVVANPIILHYARSETAGALATNGGTVHWVPLGDITPNHWAENTTPGTTDMAAAIQAAEDYRATVSGYLTFLEATYRSNSQLRVRTSNATWLSAKSTQLWFYTDAGTDCILAAADDATDPETAAISGLEFSNIIARRVSAGSTSAVWRFQNVTGVQLDKCYGWGGFTDFLFEGCRNVFARDCSFNSTSFAGGTNSAGVKVTALNMTDGSKLTGYTFSWRGLLGSVSANDHGIWLESIDYAVLDTYVGTAALNRVYIHPTHADHHVYNVELLPAAYTDGPTPTADMRGVTIDGVGSGAVIDLIRLNGTITGQLDRGLYIKAGSPVARVNVIGADIHNTLREAIFAEACTYLRLSIIGGSILKWNYSGTAVGNEEHAIRALGGKTLQILGVNFDANGTAMPAILAAGFEDVIIEGNVGANLTSTPVSQNNNTRFTSKNNSGNTTWPDVASEKNVAYTPTISFAGAAVGVAYAGHSGVCSVDSNNWVDFSSYGFLSSKGSSTGQFRVNLPFTAAAGVPYSLSVSLSTVTDPTNTVDYRALIGGGTSYAFVRAKLSTGGTEDLTDAHINNATSFIISGRYKRE